MLQPGGQIEGPATKVWLTTEAKDQFFVQYLQCCSTNIAAASLNVILLVLLKASIGVAKGVCGGA